MMIRLFLIFMMAGLALGCASGPGVGSKAPAPAPADSPGDSLIAESYGSKVLVLYFWATWCQPCRNVSPLIQEIHEEFFPGGRVSVVGVHYNLSKDAAAYMESSGCTYGLVSDGTGLADAYGVKKIPALIIIGIDGNVLYRQTGLNDQDTDNASRLIAEHLPKK